MTSMATLIEADAAALDDEQLQRVLGLLLHEYAERILAATETPLAPYAPEAGITATEALVVAGQILRTADISSFELATILNI
ncbi:MAG: hypothetical protein V7607_5930 [Solirubrobacteraceae bacterium]